MVLVDRKGRKFLLVIGTGGIIVSHGWRGIALHDNGKAERGLPRAQCRRWWGRARKWRCALTRRKRASCLPSAGEQRSRGIDSDRASLAIIYSYGDFTAATSFVRSDDAAAPPIEITRASCVPANRVEAFFENPFANLDAARTAPLKIEKALVGSVPEQEHGWLVALGLYLFMAFYAMGPGVVVWLALSELMPTRIRSNGMSIALVINQLVSTTLAAIFLPFVSKHGYSSMFFLFASFTVCISSLLSSSCLRRKAKRWRRLRRSSKGGRRAGRRKRLEQAKPVLRTRRFLFLFRTRTANRQHRAERV